MNPFRKLIVSLVLLAPGLAPQAALAADAADLARKFKQLPTVPEDKLPVLPNKLAPFRGVIKSNGYVGHTWVAFPFVENAASLDIDPKGRVFVSEANRFWLGVPDLRGAEEMVRDDFKAVTVEDRLAMYEKYASHYPEGWFTKVADRVIRLDDRDGNGAPDHRALFSDHFHKAEDGIGFSVLAEKDAVYFTCIPSVWKMTDADDDGVADTHEPIASGFGVHVSFIGHDLHGIVRAPDGRLYFSVGDRSYHFTTADGKVHSGMGKGAVFRCESDGSGLEVYAMGLRNPQELAFDDHGNLFTFDNTGDIGDLARMVYVLENSDSGWNMAHQSAHQYAKVLDWGDFRPARSVWVEEKMFGTWNEDQPQWIYPPAANVATGPSGCVWLTGDTVPEDLKGHFLLTDYRGGPQQSSTIAVGLEPKGAGYGAKDVKEFVKGVAASDVELGYDGRIYFADFGGGWSVNTSASIQVLDPVDPAAKKAGAEVARLISEGMGDKGLDDLESLLGHPDQRVRLAAQFEFVARGEKDRIEKLAKGSAPLLVRLHALWALGEFGRKGGDVTAALLSATSDPDPEVRANAARVLGDLRALPAREAMIAQLKDESPRVRSLAAIALGNICKPSDAEASAALYTANQKEADVVLRHSILSALDRIGTVEMAAAKVTSDSREERLLAVLFLRRHSSPELAAFLSDADPVVRREAIRAIYDTDVLDSPVGRLLASLSPAGLPKALQRRIIAANYRLGQPENAQRMLALASESSLPLEIRQYSLHGLAMWEAAIDTDPVLGHYRPQVVKERSKDKLGVAITAVLRSFLAEKNDPKLVTLAIKLANETGVTLDEATLRSNVADATLDADVRVAMLDSLVGLGKAADDAIILGLLKDQAPEVRAAAIRLAFSRKLDGVDAIAFDAIATGSQEAARAAIAGLDDEKLGEFWASRETKLRKELWLDVYSQLIEAGDAAVQSWAAEKVGNAQLLAESGGNVGRGEQVFRNQGACVQCHMVDGAGGIQGPDLTMVADRLSRAKILESIINPNAEIAEGYGLSTVTLRDGSTLMGRLAKESPAEVTLVGLDGAETQLKLADIDSVTPPVSAMPPVGMALPLPDLRDLVAYIASRSKESASEENAASHGESAEEKVGK